MTGTSCKPKQLKERRFMPKRLYLSETKCIIGKCDNKAYARYMCSQHYKRWQRKSSNVDPIGYGRNIDYLDLLSRVSIGDSCWKWNGTHTDKGYARGSIKGKHYRLHKLFYENMICKVESNLVLDHLCENRWCVNPFHLEQVTNAENLSRAAMNRRIYHD